MNINKPLSYLFSWCLSKNIPTILKTSNKLTSPRVFNIEFRWETSEYWKLVRKISSNNTIDIDSELELLEKILKEELLPKINFLVLDESITEIILGYDPMTLENFHKLTFVGQLVENSNADSVIININKYEDTN